jgi:autotransporter-associated beta strand protein
MDVQEGLLIANNAQALGSPNSGTTVESGAALGLQSDVESEPLTLNGNGFLATGHYDGGGTLVPDHFYGALRNISNNNTYTGPITLQTDTTIGVDSGSTLTIGAKSGLQGTGTIAGAAPGQSQGLTKESTGTLILATANPGLLGPVTVVQGALRITDGGALGSTFNGTTVEDGAQLQVQGGITVAGEPLTLSGTGIFGTGALLNSGGNNTWGGPITLTSIPVNLPPPTLPSPAVSIGVSNAFDVLTITGSIGGPFGLTKVGPGKAVLTTADTYAGVATVQAGILSIQTPAALGVLGDAAHGLGTVVDDGGTLQLDLSPANPTAVTPAIQGEGLTLNGAGANGIGALDNVSGANTWAGVPGLPGTIVLASSAAIGVEGPGPNTGGSLTVTSDIDGPAGSTLGKVGPGTLFLPNGNTYLGPTDIQAGIVNISNPTALGPVNSQGTTVENGGTLQLQASAIHPLEVTSEALILNGSGSASNHFNGALEGVGDKFSTNTWDGPVTLFSSSTIGVDHDTTLVINGAIGQASISSDLTKVDIGKLVLTNNGNNYGGTTFINAGTVQITVANALGLTTGGTIVAAGAALELNPTKGTTFNEPLTLNGTGFMGNTGALRNLGPVVTPVGGTNTWAGPIILNTTSVIGTDAGTGLDVTGSIGQGATAAGLTKEGLGTLTLAGANTYDGTTLVDAGVVVVANALALGSTVGGTVVTSGAALQLSNASVTGETLTLNGHGTTPTDGALENVAGNNSWAGPIILASDTTIGVDPKTNLTILGFVSDATPGANFTFTKENTGTLVLTQADTYGGVTLINNGILVIQDPGALGGTANGTFVANLAALEVDMDGKTIAEPLTLNGQGFGGNTGALRALSGNNTWSGPVVLNTSSSVGVDLGATLDITGVVSDGNNQLSLSKEGTGTLVLGGNNTYGGLTLVDAGILNVANPSALGAAGNPAVNGTIVRKGAELDLASSVTDGEAVQLNGPGVNNAGALHNVSGNNTWSGPVVLASDSALGADAYTTLTLLSPISQTASSNLSKELPGRVVLTQPSSFNGTTTIDGGALQMTIPDALSNGMPGVGTSSITVNNGGALELNFPLALVNRTVHGVPMSLKKQESDCPLSSPFTESGELAHNLAARPASVGAVDSSVPVRDSRRRPMPQPATAAVPPRAHRPRWLATSRGVG